MNVYKFKFVAICPHDGRPIKYKAKLLSTSLILAEDFKSFCQKELAAGYQEDLTHKLARKFDCLASLVGVHAGVKIKTYR